MNIEKFKGGYDKNFSYLIWCEKTKYAAIIDPSVESTKIIEKIQNLQLFLSKIIITHTHKDHYQNLTDFIYYYPDIEVFCHEKSTNIFKKYNVKSITNNEIIAIGEILLISLFTPGHYYDSICFWNKKNKILFTGDTMFVGRTGRVKSSSSDITKLYNSIYEVLLKLPSDTMILPGHHYGYKESISIKENKANYSFFQCESLNEFMKVMKKFEENFKK